MTTNTDSMTKSELLAAAADLGVDATSAMTKAEIKAVIEKAGSGSKPVSVAARTNSPAQAARLRRRRSHRG